MCVLLDLREINVKRTSVKIFAKTKVSFSPSSTPVFVQFVLLLATFFSTGKCIAGSKKQFCHCGPKFAGPLCEIDLCNCSCDDRDQHCPCVFPLPEECQSNAVQKCRPGVCKNGGTCVESRGNPVCRSVHLNNILKIISFVFNMLILTSPFAQMS